MEHTVGDAENFPHFLLKNINGEHWKERKYISFGIQEA